MTSLVMLDASSVSAHTLAVCTPRTTHVSHGGETDHSDLVEGRVMRRDWWFQEGTATDYTIVDCGTGRALMFRTAEGQMSARPAFDRTDQALDVVALHERGSRTFATFERMAGDLNSIAHDVEIKTLGAEPCGCAAAYSELRGDKDQFSGEAGN